MTFPNGASHVRQIDPLTDSAAHRLGLGTQVRMYLYGGTFVDCGLLAIRDVTNWDDLVARLVRGMPIEVLASRRRILGGGAVMWAEVLSDPIEEAPPKPSPPARSWLEPRA
jgi:hypothetical protein